MGRASRGKEHSDWQRICKIAELAENTLAVLSPKAILAVALPPRGMGERSPHRKSPCKAHRL